PQRQRGGGRGVQARGGGPVRWRRDALEAGDGRPPDATARRPPDATAPGSAAPHCHPTGRIGSVISHYLTWESHPYETHLRGLGRITLRGQWRVAAPAPQGKSRANEFT